MHKLDRIVQEFEHIFIIISCSLKITFIIAP